MVICLKTTETLLQRARGSFATQVSKYKLKNLFSLSFRCVLNGSFVNKLELYLSLKVNICIIDSLFGTFVW